MGLARLDALILRLARPQGAHTYRKGIHATPCDACDVLAELRELRCDLSAGATS